MDYEMVHIAEKKVIGLLKKTTNQDMQAVTDISGLWQEFLTGIYAGIKGKVNDKIIGLYTDYEGDHSKPYNFLACCEVDRIDDVQPSLVIRKIPAGKYAKFTAQGQYQKVVVELWQTIWGSNLNRKYTYDFEVYHNDMQKMDSGQIDIYISLI